MAAQPTILDWILDFFWPSRCAFCGEIIAPNHHCCKRCKSTFTICPPFSVSNLDVVFCFTEYSHSVARAVHLLKFKNQPQLAKLFAQLITLRFRQQILHFSPDCVCWVAMHPKKKYLRGYNQAELIAKELAVLLGLPSYPLLSKTAHTAAQHTLSAAQRKTNLTGVYSAVMPTKTKGQRILLVDDVITTGSTMTECAKALIEQGAAWVGGVCFAHPVIPD